LAVIRKQSVSFIVQKDRVTDSTGDSMIPLLLPDVSVARTTVSAQSGTELNLTTDFSFAALVEEDSAALVEEEIAVVDEGVENPEDLLVETEAPEVDDTQRDSLDVFVSTESPAVPLHDVAQPVFVQNTPAPNEKDRAIMAPPPRTPLQEQSVADPRNPERLNSEPVKGLVPGTKEHGVRVFTPSRAVGLPMGTQHPDLAVKAGEASPLARKPIDGLMETSLQRPTRHHDLEVDHKPIQRIPVAPTGLAPSAAIAIQAEVQSALVPSEKIELDPVAAVSSELNAAQRLSPVQSPPAQVETVRHVASQLAGAVADRPGRPTEIALNPEELGRVRLTISAVDTAITLNISAERQETTDLLRRHIDALAQEFKELGYDDISFSFGEREGSQEADVGHLMRASDLSGDDEDDVTRSPTMMASASSLDIKL
jgi:hypothetical protein